MRIMKNFVLALCLMALHMSHWALSAGISNISASLLAIGDTVYTAADLSIGNITTPHGHLVCPNSGSLDFVYPTQYRNYFDFTGQFSLPFGAENTTVRAAQLDVIRSEFLYGEDIASGLSDGPYYPTGPYADKIIAEMNATFYSEHNWWKAQVRAESFRAFNTITWWRMLHRGLRAFRFVWLNKFQHFSNLYKFNWPTTFVDGPYPGILENATSDLGFAMERLSLQPYAVRRFPPGVQLEFEVDDAVAMELSTMTMEDLHSQGRLFYVDHREQGKIVLTEGRFAAACDAYFFLHPVSGDFLPLAIRPNAGSPLIYTPLDPHMDWTLAKIMFNINDFWYGQWYHLVATHEVIDLVYSAAIRSLSIQHPLYALLSRIAHQTFVFRPIAISELIQPTGPVDRVFAWNGSSAGDYSAYLYHKEANRWTSNYFEAHLERRGLLNSTFPAPAHFPFLDDASTILGAIRTYMLAFVESYYADDAAVAADHELQGLVHEATLARIAEFPTQLRDRDALVRVLAHAAYLVTILHGTINGNAPAHGSAVLPMHPGALWAPLPAEKGVTDLRKYLPGTVETVLQVTLFANFNRPFLAGSGRALANMFATDDLLRRTNDRVRDAEAAFREKMLAQSAAVQSRRFDAQGLSQGMPFLWLTLDPLTATCCLTI